MIYENTYGFIPPHFFETIPDNMKYDVVIEYYTGADIIGKSLNKYIKAIKPFIPAEIAKEVAEYADSEGNITVYRGGIFDKNPALYPSWTLDIDKAEWFAKRFLFQGDTVLYKGIIKPKDVIGFRWDRGESEIIQYQGVKKIEVIREYKKSEYDPDNVEKLANE